MDKKQLGATLMSGGTDKGSNDPQPPDSFAQTTPQGITRSFDEMNTGQMVFELQKTVGEIQETLRSLAPKIDDVAGFIKHRAPDLASKVDMIQVKTDLEAAISLRPTRRQSIFDIVWVVSLITGAVTFGSKLAH